MGKNPSRTGVGVGIRGKTGRFEPKNARLAGVFEKDDGNMDVDEAGRRLSSLEAIKRGFQVGGLRLTRQGKIDIHSAGNGIVITITKSKV
jgi:hypothetical protein